MASQPEPQTRDGRRAAVYAPRVGEVIAATLRARILNGQLQDGDELPTEGALLEEFPVSRPTLRESLRILETEGLIRIRRGKRGGCIVRAPRAESAAYHFGLVLQNRRVGLDDLGRARAVLEPACAALAAERPDHAAVADELDAIVGESEEAIESGHDFTASALKFHEALVRLSGNATIEILVGMLEATWGLHERRWAEAATNFGEYPSADLRRKVVKAHRRIVNDIRAGDPGGASREARKHLTASQAFVGVGGDPKQPVEVVDTRQLLWQR
jgi:GntR family transcriptional regulator, transcriptional repressor for pyruvate dehydrogenase complex